MVSAPSTFQKSLTQNKIKKIKSHQATVKEIKRCRKNNLMYVNKLPYKHLINVFSKQMKELCENEDQSVNMLHEASQAYLSGIFEGYTNVCQSVAKKESTQFLLCLASLGLKKLVSVISNDKRIAAAAKKSEQHFHRNSIHLDNMEDNEEHQHHHDHEHNQHQHHGHNNHHYHHHDSHENHNHRHDSRENHNHHHENHDNHSRQNNNDRSENIDNVIRHIMRRISSNVTVSVHRA